MFLNFAGVLNIIRVSAPILLKSGSHFCLNKI
jgi:hypothetical protein